MVVRWWCFGSCAAGSMVGIAREEKYETTIKKKNADGKLFSLLRFFFSLAEVPTCTMPQLSSHFFQRCACALCRLLCCSFGMVITIPKQPRDMLACVLAWAFFFFYSKKAETFVLQSDQESRHSLGTRQRDCQGSNEGHYVYLCLIGFCYIWQFHNDAVVVGQLSDHKQQQMHWHAAGKVQPLSGSVGTAILISLLTVLVRLQESPHRSLEVVNNVRISAHDWR